MTITDMQQVRAALEKPEYDWRTLRGVAEEVQLPLDTVRDAIRAMGRKAVKSEIPSVTGEELFTTVEHYQRIKPTAEDGGKVLEALGNREFKWRTIRGISEETQLSVPKVVAIIRNNSDKILQSETPSASGEPLYTSRSRYLEESGPLDKMLGFFRNRLT